MTTFVLKKYQDTPPSTEVKEGENPEAAPKKEELMIEIYASDTIAKIVASALYKAMPNNVEITEKEDSKTPGTEVSAVSTEDINSSPVDCLQKVKNGSTLLIMSNGFKTAKENWFLSSMENKNVKLFYTAEGLVGHVKTSLGV